MNERLEVGADVPIDALILDGAAEADLRPLEKFVVRLSVRRKGPFYDDLADAVRSRMEARGVIYANGQVKAALDWQTILVEVIIPLLLELFGGFGSRR